LLPIINASATPKPPQEAGQASALPQNSTSQLC
jgi:hypothetical protein